MSPIRPSGLRRGRPLAEARTALGRRGEDIACATLERKGWRIVDRNWRCKEGEVDVVAARAGVLAFVEVKTRRSRAFGPPAEAVTRRKRERLRALALRYLADRRPRARAIRFDVFDVLVERDRVRVVHLEGAFW